MNRFFTTLLSLLFIFSASAQQIKSVNTSNKNPEKPFSFSGQWKGIFVDNSSAFMGFGGERVDYVLELECTGTEVNGYSYTYFTDGGKRYYTICKLNGTLNTTTKEVTVTEIERTKYNTPPEIRNCFQTHKLRYSKENSDTESLKGSWIPAPNQSGDCGYGKTTLFRRIVKNNFVKKQEANIPLAKKNEQFKDMNRKNPVTKQTSPVVKTPNKNQSTSQPPLVKNDNPVKKIIPQKTDTIVKRDIPVNKPIIKEPLVTSNLKFENRINSVLKTIQIKNEKFTVDFYDNGEIDGDTISVFFNGKLVLSHRMLTDKPITLTLNADPTKPLNELVMYAESLGTIPPNTALMIVHDGDNRYETRIESDLGKNGTIRFTYQPKDTP